MMTTGLKFNPPEVEVVHQIVYYFGWYHIPRRAKSCLSSKRNYPKLEYLLHELLFYYVPEKILRERIGEPLGSIRSLI